MQSLINKWSVMPKRGGQPNSDQSDVKSQRATHMCLIRVAKESVTRLTSTNHKWNRTKDSRALECVGSVELVFSTRSIEYSFVRACFRQCFLGRSGLIFVLRAVGNRCKMTFLRAAPMMVCAVPSVWKKCQNRNLCLLFAKFDPLWSQIKTLWSQS